MHYKYKSSSCILYLSSIRHTCSVHVLSKILMRIYRIIVYGLTAILEICWSKQILLSAALAVLYGNEGLIRPDASA